jgi:signal transduction histidine kinase
MTFAKAVRGEDMGGSALREELERLQAELDQHVRLNAMLSDAAEQFVGSVAHDVKNPLAAIKVNVQSMKRAIERSAPFEPERWIERLGRIELAVEQTLEHIAAARARVSASASLKPTLKLAPFDLVGLVEEVAGRYRQAAGEGRLALDCRVPALPGTWDRERLAAALHAIVDNALKFSPDDTQVVLDIDQQPGAAVVRCADRGIGIPARDVRHVCERFYRGENVVGRYRGAGLGLFEARATIQAHGGSLELDSAEKAGCTVTIRLPLSP